MAGDQAIDRATGALGSAGRFTLRAGKWALIGGGILAAFALVANPAAAAAVVSEVTAASATAEGGALGAQIMAGEAGIFTGAFEAGKVAITEGVPFVFTEGLPPALTALANTASGGAEALAGLAGGAAEMAAPAAEVAAEAAGPT